MARKYASRTHFVHLRSCHIFEKIDPSLPMRVDHGRTMFDDAEKGYNAGYSFHGRMFAMGQIQGVMAVIDRELGIVS